MCVIWANGKPLAQYQRNVELNEIDYMKKIELILLMVFCVVGVATSKDNAPKKYLVLELNKADMDTINPNVINMDSVQIAAFNFLINDPVPYYKRDTILQDSINSLRKGFDSFVDEVKKGEYNTTEHWVRILLFSVAILLVVIVLYLVLRLRGLRDEIVDVVTDSNRIKEWVKKGSEKPSIIPVSKSYDGDIRSLQNENRDLRNRVVTLEDMLKERNTSSDMESPATFSQQSSSRLVETQKLLYADSIIDGVFSHVKEKENDDTVFVLRLKNETNASITLHKGAYNKVLANASYLEGCEKQIIGNNTIEIVREGEAEKGFNGKWKVVSPLKVEIR